MTINLARIIGAACVSASILVSAVSLAAAQSAPLGLSPVAQSAPKAAAPVKTAAIPVAAKSQKASRYIIRAPESGNSDLAFLSSAQYVQIAAFDRAILVVAENEMSPLDFTAGTVRVVDPDELTEIDLANEPDWTIAQNKADQTAKPIVQASATATPPRNDDEDDGVLNRILMTFAGALAMASAMRMIIA
ncbi:MAG: hypothetical protein ABUL48_06430 [Pseudorhodoplanes sp.]